MIFPNVNLLYWIVLKVVFYKDLLCQLWVDLYIRKFLKYFKEWVFNYFTLFHVLCKVMYTCIWRDQYQGFSLFVLHLLFEIVSVSLWSCCYIFTQLTNMPWCLSVFFFPILRLQLLLIAMPGYCMSDMERNHIRLQDMHFIDQATSLVSPWTVDIQYRSVISSLVKNVKLFRR